MKKKFQVFISSTYEDLIEERKEVVQTILSCNCIPAGMELFPASNRTQWEVIKGVIDDCDYYLVIVAGKYGSQGEDEEGNIVSYTEMEFDYALKTNKPIIALIHKHPERIPAIYTEKSEMSCEKLNNFKRKAMSGRLVGFWDNKDNLSLAVIKSLTNICINSPGIGWIKGNGTTVNYNNENPETIILKPENFEESTEVATYLMQNKIVSLNLENLDIDAAQRVIDFISGVVFALDGTMQKISSYTYIMASGAINIKNPKFDDLSKII